MKTSNTSITIHTKENNKGLKNKKNKQKNKINGPKFIAWIYGCLIVSTLVSTEETNKYIKSYKVMANKDFYKQKNIIEYSKKFQTS